MPNLEIEEKRRIDDDPISNPTPNPTTNPTPHTKGDKGGKANGQKTKEGKGGTKAIKFTWLGPSEFDPVIGEIPENEVNVATS